MVNLVAWLAWSSLLVLWTDLVLFWLEGDETLSSPCVHRRTCLAMATEEFWVRLTKLIFRSNRGRVCQDSSLMSAKRQKTWSVDTAFCLQHPSTNLTIFAPPCSKLTFKHSPTSDNHDFLCVCLPLSLFPDHGVDRPRVWEQRSHQHRRRSQLPEVPSHLLPLEPVIPPHWRGLGPGIQPRPEGEIVGTFLCPGWTIQTDLCLYKTRSGVSKVPGQTWSPIGGTHWFLCVPVAKLTNIKRVVPVVSQGFTWVCHWVKVQKY